MVEAVFEVLAKAARERGAAAATEVGNVRGESGGDPVTSEDDGLIEGMGAPSGDRARGRGVEDDRLET